MSVSDPVHHGRVMSVGGVRPSGRVHDVRVRRLVREAGDATSVVLDIPDDLADAFAYRAGQFVTLRASVGDVVLSRSYSMSSAPAVDAELQVTVKRVPDGRMSNWVNDDLAEGDTISVSEPSGGFVLTDSRDPIVAFAGGSGITPIFSIVKTVLHTSDRRVRLLFANRDRPSAIFGAELDRLATEFPGRLVVHHHEDATDGFVRGSDALAFARCGPAADVYLCGPTGFMDVVEGAMRDGGIDDRRIHLERFTPSEVVEEPVPDPGSATDRHVHITVGRRTESVTQRGRATILQSARFGGLPIQSSCEQGHCGTCIAQVVTGEVEMLSNDILTDDEVADGWVLTCQAIPVSDDVQVVYDP